jgi:hypothetical protein
MSKLGIAGSRGGIAAALAIALAACAGTPPQYTQEQLAALGKSARAEEICRYREPVGSHIANWVCLTPAEDLAQRDMGQTILRRGLEAPWRP